MYNDTVLKSKKTKLILEIKNQFRIKIISIPTNFELYSLKQGHGFLDVDYGLLSKLKFDVVYCEISMTYARIVFNRKCLVGLF